MGDALNIASFDAEEVLEFNLNNNNNIEIGKMNCLNVKFHGMILFYEEDAHL